MVVCKYFLEGRCRFGQSCRNQHSYNTDDRSNRAITANTQQLKDIIRDVACEMVLTEKGGQWPLSCFAPLREGPNIPGFDDISPEEIRWKMYEARRNGTLNQCINEVNQLYREAEKRRNNLKQPKTENIGLIVQMLKGKKEPTNVPNCFASSNLNNSGTIFATGSQNTFKDSAQFCGNIFGGSSQPMQNQGNIFAGNSNNYAQQSVFGGSNSQNTFNQNIFSNPQSQKFSNPAQNSFFNTVSSSNQPMISNMQGVENESAANSNMTTFASAEFPIQVTSTPIFAMQNMLYPSGNNINQTAPGIFGGTRADNVFNNQNLLLKGAENFKFEISNTNSFGKQTQPNMSANAFGGSHPVSIDYSLYSKVDDLTTEELQAFAAATFTFGKIPLKPPPLESCK